MINREEARAKEERVKHYVRYGMPLDRLGRHATMLAVLEIMTVDDAAQSVGLSPEALICEAEAWAVAAGMET